MRTRRPPRRIRVGISACLLGRQVRYDGGHKRDRSILTTLGRRFDLVPVCPELELGLGVPREPLRLEGDRAAPRLVFRRSRLDITRRMSSWARRRVRDLETSGLSGFVLKSRSPSCGLMRVPIHQQGRGGAPALRGRGLFAGALAERFPSLPVVEEIDLHSRSGREDFVRRVLAFKGKKMPYLRGGGTGKGSANLFSFNDMFGVEGRQRHRRPPTPAGSADPPREGIPPTTTVVGHFPKGKA